MLSPTSVSDSALDHPRRLARAIALIAFGALAVLGVRAMVRPAPTPGTSTAAAPPPSQLAMAIAAGRLVLVSPELAAALGDDYEPVAAQDESGWYLELTRTEHGWHGDLGEVSASSGFLETFDFEPLVVDGGVVTLRARLAEWDCGEPTTLVEAPDGSVIVTRCEESHRLRFGEGPHERRRRWHDEQVATYADVLPADIAPDDCWIAARGCDPARRILVCGDSDGAFVAEPTSSVIRTSWQPHLELGRCGVPLTGVQFQ